MDHLWKLACDSCECCICLKWTLDDAYTQMFESWKRTMVAKK